MFWANSVAPGSPQSGDPKKSPKNSLLISPKAPALPPWQGRVAVPEPELLRQISPAPVPPGMPNGIRP